MKIKNFVEQKPIPGILYPKISTTFDVYTEIKNRRQELDALLVGLTEYKDQNNKISLDISNKILTLEEVENKIDLSQEQLEFVITEIKLDKKYKQQLFLDIKQQEEDLQKLIQIIKDRTLEADRLQQTLTNFKNQQTEFEALQKDITSKEELLIGLNNELLAKQALLETFERNYSAKLHKKVVITKKTKFNYTGQI